jgi:hypothetical protein
MTAVTYGDEFFRGVVGLDGLRILLNDVLTAVVRGDGSRAPTSQQRIDTRQNNDASARHAPPRPKSVASQLAGHPTDTLPPQASPDEAVIDSPTTLLPIIPDTKTRPSGDGRPAMGRPVRPNRLPTILSDPIARIPRTRYGPWSKGRSRETPPPSASSMTAM